MRHLLRRWRSLPVIVRDAVGAALLAVALLGWALPVPQLSWETFLEVAAAWALVGRRVAPVPTLAVTGACLVVSPMLGAESGSGWIPALIAVYSAIAWGRRWLGVAAAVLETAALTLSIRLSGDTWAGADPVGLALLFALTLVISLLVQSRRSTLATIRERSAQAEQARELEAMGRVAEERLRIARELHDVLGHHLAIVNVQSAVAEQLLDVNPEAARAALGHVQDATGSAMSELSALLEVLRDPQDLAELRPSPGLGRLDELVSESLESGLDLQVSRTGSWPPTLAPVVDLAAFRIVQEALTNAHKYASGVVRLDLDSRPGSLVIVATNRVAEHRDGQRSVASGFGLRGLQERVDAVGGRLTADLVADGFRLEVVLPALLVDAEPVEAQERNRT